MGAAAYEKCLPARHTPLWTLHRRDSSSHDGGQGWNRLGRMGFSVQPTHKKWLSTIAWVLRSADLSVNPANNVIFQVRFIDVDFRDDLASDAFGLLVD